MFKKKKIKKSWGYIEELGGGTNWRCDKIVIKPGQSDKLHAQTSSRHSCYVASGTGRIHIGLTVDVLASSKVRRDVEFVINADWLHRFENTGKTDLVIIQNSYGPWDLEEMVESL